MEAVRTDIADWIVRAALDGTHEIDVLAGICERLNALGLSLMRASVANSQLDPTHDARGVRWLRDSGIARPRTMLPASTRSAAWLPR